MIRELNSYYRREHIFSRSGSIVCDYEAKFASSKNITELTRAINTTAVNIRNVEIEVDGKHVSMDVDPSSLNTVLLNGKF